VGYVPFVAFKDELSVQVSVSEFLVAEQLLHMINFYGPVVFYRG
jgi:hypothetical protein